MMERVFKYFKESVSSEFANLVSGDEIGELKNELVTTKEDLQSAKQNSVVLL